MCILKNKHNYAFSDLVEVTNNRTFSVNYLHIDVTMRRSFDFLLRLFFSCSCKTTHNIRKNVIQPVADDYATTQTFLTVYNIYVVFPCHYRSRV
jgi:hypothetical protein